MHGYVVFCLLSLVFVRAFTDFSFTDVECKLMGGEVFVRGPQAIQENIFTDYHRWH